MTKWIVCKYGMNHIQSPFECKPVGIAIQKDRTDSEYVEGFIDIDRFSKWLEKNDLCAFGWGYRETLGGADGLPIVYNGKGGMLNVP